MANVKIYSSYSESAKLSISCLICGEPVELDEMERSRLNYGLHIHSKICDKCTKAILHYRKELEEKESEKR